MTENVLWNLNYKQKLFFFFLFLSFILIESGYKKTNMKTQSKWMLHLMQTKKEHPKMSLVEAMKAAKKTYKK